MNIMTHHGVVAAAADISEIAESTSAACISTRVRQLSRIITRVYDDAMRPSASRPASSRCSPSSPSRTASRRWRSATTLDIEKSTLSRNLKRLLALGHITMDPPAGRRGRGLHLTPKGQMVIQQGFPVWREAQTRTIRVLGPESRNTLDGLLGQAEKLAAA